MINMCTSLHEPPVACLWWMLTQEDDEPQAQVKKRAQGRLLVLEKHTFRSGSSSSRPPGLDSSSDKGLTAGQQLHMRQRMTPAQQRSAAAADGGGGASRGGRVSTADRKQRLNYAALAYSRPYSNMEGQYSSSDDSVVLEKSQQTVAMASSRYKAYMSSYRNAGRVKGALLKHEQLQELDPQQLDPRQLQQLWLDVRHLQQLEKECETLGSAHRHAAAACLHQMMLSPQAEQFRQEALASLALGSQPPGSTSSASSVFVESSDDEGSNQGPLQLQGFRSQQEQQQRMEQRQLRAVLCHKWGTRSWRIRRAALLVRRQVMLNRLSMLQGAAVKGLMESWRLATEAAALGDSGAEQPGNWLMRCPSPSELTAAVQQQLLLHWEATGRIPPSPSARNPSRVVLHVRLKQADAVQQPPSGPTLVPPAPQLLQHVAPRLDDYNADQPKVTECLHNACVDSLGGQQLLEELLEPDAGSEGGVAEGVAEGTGAAATAPIAGLCFWQAVQLWHMPADESPTATSVARSLLWKLLSHTKPAACHWYKAAAVHHRLQQQQKPKSGASAAATAAAAAADAAALHVPESGSAGLWSTLTSSLASDLLLVPPSIRDLVGNGWAAGAGRLQGLVGANEGYTSSSDSSAAAGVGARMLLVQYARALRRQYTKVRRWYRKLGTSESAVLPRHPVLCFVSI
jgi:hypothetical protein